MDNSDNNKTIKAYETGLGEYNAAAIPNVIGSVKDWVDATLDLLPNNARILELGSAHGRDADYIESRGYTVDRTDAAQSFVDYMQSEGHEARKLNALTDDFGEPYDMIYANAVLLHFNPQQCTRLLKRVHNSLNTDGLLSFSVKIGDGSAWSDKKLKSPRFFTYWQEQPLKNLLTENGFNIVFWREGKTGHDNGDWYHVIAKAIS